MSRTDTLVWMDLEMTGLDPEDNVIIEIATIITDDQLNIVAEGPVIAVHQSDFELGKMDDWNVKTHNGSGLVERVKTSTVSMEDAEKQTIEFIAQFVKKGHSPLCGNSIHQDRRFLVKQMPLLEEFMHYRNIDVSTLKELAKRWKPAILPGFTKSGSHKALDDILESIAEMKYYREHFLAE
ncbi:MAG: oligoribonuclease [Oleispira antarctica]|nr:oligoribonuclease [Oleispira antarctica]MBQ0791292.1 oligoribonuclease [Oleispira antarctica]|tara:strand:+ start:245 stop:787 length:543 start_codon:yes stop_codon:yes gene_type:complete